VTLKRLLVPWIVFLPCFLLLLWNSFGNPSQSNQETPVPVEMKPYTEALPGTAVKLDMVPIREGTFTMGSSASERGRLPDEGPRHQV
jgi:formylglycine-generating enzyme required for sulfatase activity